MQEQQAHYSGQPFCFSAYYHHTKCQSVMNQIYHQHLPSLIAQTLAFSSSFVCRQMGESGMSDECDEMAEDSFNDWHGN